MRAEWKLTTHFMRRHMRQQVGSVLTITLFATAILLMLFMSQCFKASNEQLAYNYYGDFSGETMFANPAKVNAARQTLQKEGAGVIVTQTQILSKDKSDTIYIGYLDANARKLRAVRIKEGSFPHSSREIAMDKATYYRLGLSAKTGDSISLHINQGGKIKTVSYTLTGILYDYFDHWNTLAENALDYKNPKLPSVLLGERPNSAAAVHVIYPDAVQNNSLGGIYIANAEVGSMKNYANDLNKSTAFVTLGIGAFFLLLALFGISVLARVTLKDRERFIQTLNCIGLTRGQSCGLFVMQGAVLAVIAWTISLPLSFGALTAVIFAAKLLEINLLWSISFLPAAVTFVLIIGFTLIIFLIQNHKSFSTHKRKTRKRFLLAPSRTFGQAWKRLYLKSKFGKSTAITILNAGCTFALVFGVFAVQLSGATRFANLVKAQGNTDYYVSVSQGISSLQTLNASFARDMGMPGQELKGLRDDKNVNVKYAYISQAMMPAFFRVEANDTNEVLNSLKKSCTFEKSNYINDAESLKIVKKAREAFGYQKSESLVTSPKIIAVDTQTMKTLIKEANINDAQDWTAFEQGKIAYSLGGVFKNGDQFTITMPVIPKGSTASQIIGKAKTADFHVTVASAFTRKTPKANETQYFPYGTSKYPCVVISADAVMRADPQLRFEFVIANNAKPGNVAACSEASAAIHRAAAFSKGVTLTDRVENIADWKNLIRQLTLPIYALVLAFMIILMAAVAFITNIKLRTNQHSYALLRAVGIEERRLRYLLICDSLRSTGIGVITGLALSAVLGIPLLQQFSYVSMTKTMFNTVLPIAVCGSVLLMTFTAITTILTMRSLFKTSIVEALNTDMF